MFTREQKSNPIRIIFNFYGASVNTLGSKITTLGSVRASKSFSCLFYL